MQFSFVSVLQLCSTIFDVNLVFTYFPLYNNKVILGNYTLCHKCVTEKPWDKSPKLCIMMLYERTHLTLFILSQGERGECGTPGIKGDRVCCNLNAVKQILYVFKYYKVAKALLVNMKLDKCHLLQGPEGPVGPRGNRGLQVNLNFYFSWYHINCQNIPQCT